MEDLSGKKILIVVAHEDFQDIEYEKIRRALEEAGAEIRIASSFVGDCHGVFGSTIKSNILLHDAEAENYNAVVFIGGGGAQEYFYNADALNLARQMNDLGKIVSAICIGPVILANAGILNKKKATVFETGVNYLRESGAIYTGLPVEINRNIITGNGPEAAENFSQKIIEALSIKEGL